MVSFLLYPIAFLAVVSVVVFVHEFGHLVAAKALGIRVQIFSLGFGKRLTGFHCGGTDYRLSLVPVGGYIRMVWGGFEGSTQDHPTAFNSHPRWHRALVAVAGPLANIVLTVVVMTGVYLARPVHTEHLEQRPFIASVSEGSIAASVGFKDCDLIVKVDDRETATWREVQEQIRTSSNRPINVQVLRNGKLVTKQLVISATEEGKKSVGWVPEEPNTVAEITPGSAAEQAGLRISDRITSIDGQDVRTFADLVTASKRNSEQFRLIVLRGSKKLELLLPNTRSVLDEGSDESQVFGLKLQNVPLPDASISTAFIRAVEFSKNNLSFVYRVLFKMLAGKVSARQMDGPIGIMRASGEAAKQNGWQPLLTLISLLSLNIAVFNLLPFPVLDGGTLLLLGIEGVIRRDLQQKIKLRIYGTALLVLVLIFAFVIYNDISKFA